MFSPFKRHFGLCVQGCIRSLAVLMCALLPAEVSAQETAAPQGQVTTRKYRLADFPDKVTKVVLPADELLATSLRQEVGALWQSSPYEFCSQEEFERLRMEPRYYFLAFLEYQRKGEKGDGILTLALLRGGAAAAKGVEKMEEIIALPFCAARNGAGGRELVYLGGYLQAVQSFTLAAMSSEKAAYTKADWFNGNYAKCREGKEVWLSFEDLSPEVTEADREALSDAAVHFAHEDAVDERYAREESDVLASYVVAPEEPTPGVSFCYKLLFDAESHTLCYFRRHKIKAGSGVGFRPEDLKGLAGKK